LSHLITDFAIGILAAAEFVMHYVGFADHGLFRLMIMAGVLNPIYQLYIFLALLVILAFVALRVIGGLLGWFILILLVLLLLDRVVPGLNTPEGAFQTPIQNVL